MNWKVNKFIVIFIGVIIPIISFSQDIEIKGSVRNSKQESIINANVVIFENPELSKTINYDFSDEEGLFSLKLNNKLKNFTLKISSFGYKPFIKTILFVKGQLIDVILEDDAIELKEVVVKSKTIKDTMAIKTKDMNLTPTSSLRDILDKTDGFMVTKEGGISFQGVPITKVLINKKEVFINQNKIALDNLNYEMMDNVQLINNYKDKFKLDFDNFTTPVLNINTKKEFRGVLKKKMDASAGHRESYEMKAKGLFFSDSFNAFLIHNTNNIGQKEFSYEDISESSLGNASVFFKGNLTDFFIENDLLKSNFNSNTSLTIRKQGTNYKTGLLGILDYLESSKNSQNITKIFSTNNITKQEVNNLNDFGKLLTLKYYLSKILSKKSILDYSLDFGQIKKTKEETNNIRNFDTVNNIISESNITKPKSNYFSNSLNYANLISVKFLLNATINYAIENAQNGFESSFIENNANNGTVSQNYTFNSHLFLFNTSLQYKFSDLFSFELGAKYSTSDQNYSNTNNSQLSRKIGNNSFFIQGRGKTKWIDYYLKGGSEFYSFDSDNNKNVVVPKIDGSIQYKFNSNNSFVVTYNQSNAVFDLYKNMDTLTLSYNNRILGNIDFNYNITNSKKATIGFYHSNIAKSNSLNLSYTLETKNNYLETFFDKISNNVYYYKNYIIDNKQNAIINFGVSKGYYMGEKLHKITFSLNSNFKNSTFPAFSNNSTKLYELRGSLYNCEIEFQPKLFFLTEIVFSYFNNTQQMYVGDILANVLKTQTFNVELIANKGKFENKLSFSQIVNNSLNNSFNIPLINLSSLYKLNDRTSVFIKGKSLLNLFNLVPNNFSALNQFSDGIIINENINLYRINYLILGASFNF